jgi:hypothetical protein
MAGGYSLFELGSNIGHSFFVGWVEHPDIFCWVSFLYPTYLLSIYVLLAKPSKMAEDRIIPRFLKPEQGHILFLIRLAAFQAGGGAEL